MQSPVTWIIVLGIALAGGAYFLLRRRSSAGTSTATTDTPAGTVSPDWSGEIGTLQTEIEDLQSSAAQSSAADETEETAGDKDLVSVPRVIGQTQAIAYAIITAAGLRPSGQPVVKGRVRTVTQQSPAPGTKVAQGSVVKLTTRLSPEPPPGRHPTAPRAHKPGVNPPRTRASSAHVTRRQAA